MKNIKTSLGIFGLAVMLACTSCGKTNSSDNDSGSDSQTTPNDSSGSESSKAMGIGEDNQNDSLGYPSNQSNLNDTTRSKLHDADTTSASAKDQPKQQ